MSLGPVAFVDVQYADPKGTAACVVAAQWTDAVAIEERVAVIDPVAPYVPGRFFERELPCIVAVLAKIGTTFGSLVVDGYVTLDAQGTPGLGAHVHDHFGGAFPVIGVAKTAFRGSAFAAQILRGSSQTPLYVTAIGMGVDEASKLVQGMHGAHRIPTLLGRVDALARGRP